MSIFDSELMGEDSFFDGGAFSSPFDLGKNTGTLLKGAGTLFSLGGEYLQGQMSKEAFDFNASLDEFSAEATKTAGIEEQREIGIGETSMLSTQRAIAAKNNVTMHGSPLDAALVTATNFEMTKSIADYNSKMKESQYRSKASQERYFGQVAQEESQAKMASTLLSGVGSIIGMASLFV